MKFQASTGEIVEGRLVYALAAQHRATPGRMRPAYGAYRDEHDGTVTWYFHLGEWTAEQMGSAEDTYQRGLWWEAHKRDLTVIPSLDDGDLIHYRMLADIRADIPALNAAADELHRRGIRDYPIAI
jgi:hypothetical protein